jgi:hypothetical protein
VNRISPFIDRFGNLSVTVTIGNYHTAAGHRKVASYSKPAVAANFLRDLADEIDKAMISPSDEEIDKMLLKRYGKTAQQLADEAETGYDLS